MRAALKLAAMTLVVTVLAAVVPTSATADLVLNGSFEDGVSIPGDPGFLPVAGGSTTSIAGWEVLGVGVDYVGSYWVASDGQRSVDLDGSPGPGGLQQVIETIPGNAYVVTFDLAGNPCHTAPYGQTYAKYLQVAAIGATTQSQVYNFDTASTTESDMGWKNMQFAFEADSYSTILRFLSMTPAGGTEYELYCGPALDNVSVNATPVPGAALLGALGLSSSGGLLVWRKRRTL